MENEDNICNLMKKGIEYLSIDHFSQSIIYFNEILKKDDSNFAALNNKGLALNGLGKFNDAIACFDQVLTEDKDFVFSLIGKGESLYYLEFYDLAIDYFNRGLILDPLNDDVIYYKALCYNKLKQYDESLECLKEVKKISGNLLIDRNFYKRVLNNCKKESFNTRSQFINKLEGLLDNKDYFNALELVDEALKFDSKSIYFLFKKAYLLYEIDRFNESLKCLEFILDLDFMNIDALYIKSKIYFNFKMYNDALNCLSILFDLGGSVDPSYYHDLLDNLNRDEEVTYLIFKGNDFLSKGDHRSAIKCYDCALNKEPNNIIVLNNKGFLFYLLNSYENAINFFNQALSLEKDYIYSLLGKSYSLYYIGKFEEALECYRNLVIINSDYGDEDYFNLLIGKINGN